MKVCCEGLRDGRVALQGRLHSIFVNLVMTKEKERTRSRLIDRWFPAPTNSRGKAKL